MLLRSVIFVAVVAAIATQIPAMIHLLDQPPAPSVVVAQPEKPVPASVTPGSVKLQADGRGHFNATFRINGKSVDGMIDTGASLVAINESTARRLGYGANSLDFNKAVGTANGQTEAAHITLDRIEIGGLRVRDVDAYVLRDKALSSTLIGMTFLKKLKSFQVANGDLTLNQ